MFSTSDQYLYGISYYSCMLFIHSPDSWLMMVQRVHGQQQGVNLHHLIYASWICLYIVPLYMTLSYPRWYVVNISILYQWLRIIVPFQQTQHICIPFIQCRPNVSDAGPTLYKCYTNVFCLLGCTCTWRSIDINPFTASLSDLNSHPLECCVSLASANHKFKWMKITHLFKLRPTTCISWCWNTRFIPNNSDLIG